MGRQRAAGLQYARVFKLYIIPFRCEPGAWRVETTGGQICSFYVVTMSDMGGYGGWESEHYCQHLRPDPVNNLAEQARNIWSFRNKGKAKELMLRGRVLGRGRLWKHQA